MVRSATNRGIVESMTSPATGDSWVRIAALVAFIAAVLFSWHHDGDGALSVLLELLLIAAMIAVLWAAFLIGKTVQRRRMRR